MSKSAFDLAAGVPWLITEEGLSQVLAVAAREDLNPEMARALAADREARPQAVALRNGTRLSGTRNVTVLDGVAVLPVTGPIVRYSNLFTDISGGTSLQNLARDFQAAMDAPEVRAIVLSFDSSGGEARGIAEFSSRLRAARDKGGKRIVAYVDGMAASAAYWIASAAAEVVLSETAFVGSIGARFAATDNSMAEAAKGVRRVDIVSSNAPRKGDSADSAEGRRQIQAMVDALEERFVAAVAANRGVSVEAVLSDFGQGGIVARPEDAIAAGMADRIGTLEQVLTELAALGPVGSLSSLAGAAATKQGAFRMSDEKTEQPNAEAPAPAPAPAPAVAIDPVKAERERAASILAAAMPGYEQMAKASVEAGDSLATFTAAQASAERKAGAHHLEKVKADETALQAAAPAAPAAASADLSALPVEERAKAEWEKTPALRAEFGSLAAYTAFLKADADGRVRIYKPKA